MKEKGFVLILALVIMTGVLLIGLVLADHLLMQSRIQQNLYWEIKTFYLAKAGIEYAAWRLGHEPNWRTGSEFIDLQGDGQIYLEVVEDVTGIIVRSKGHYQKSQREIKWIFSKEVPMKRIQ